jgi:hypothetical protein
MIKFIEHALGLLLVMASLTAYAGEVDILFQEDFNNLENWRPLYFEKIEKHSSYNIVSDATDTYLKAESDASASGLVYKNEFNVYQFPRISWQWKVENIYLEGNAKTKAGDDYPVRIYIMFKSLC